MSETTNTAQPHQHGAESPFSWLLKPLTTAKPEYDTFDAGYEHVRANVANEGSFDLQGLRLSAPPGVYKPGPGSSTEFCARNRHSAGLVPSGGRLLELGCGSGALSLLAARDGWDVTGADIEPVAVSAAQANAALNGLNATFKVSNMFSAFRDETFDVLLFNLPFYHKSTAQDDERTLSDVGGGLARIYFDEAHGHLRPGGRLVFSWSNCSDARLLERDDWRFEVVACDYEGLSRYWRALLVGTPLA